MTKRSFLTVFFISIIFCLIATFLYLLISRGRLSNINHSEIPGQSSFLALQVDSLSDNSPVIVSSWIILIRTDPPAQIIFKQVSPALFQTNSDSKKTPYLDGLSVELFNQFARDLNLVLDSYFILDNRSVETLSSQINPQSSILNEELLSQFCQNLEKFQKKPAKRITWNELIPSHLRTNLSYETFATTWEVLTQSESSPLCQVISLSEENAAMP